MKKFLILLLIEIILFPFILKSSFLNTSQIPTGIRAISMGETFTGIADDSTAIRWNVAGLAQLHHSELSLMYIPSRYMSGIYNSYISFTFPFQKINHIAIDWLYTGFNEEDEFINNGIPELEYGENFVYTGWAKKFINKLYGGIVLKYYSININYDGENWAKGYGIGADIGVLYPLKPGLKIGLSVKNIIPLKVSYKNSTSETILNPAITIGVGYSPLKKLIVGMDINDSIHIGGEYWFLKMFAARAGIIKGIIYGGDDSITLSGGIGVRYKFMQFDYAYIYNPDLSGTHNFSATLSWGYHAYLVDVISVNIEDMFAGLYKMYANEEVVRLMVKNKSKKPIDATIGVYIPDYMKNPTQKRVKLLPQTPTEIKLPILFSKNVMKVKDDIAENAEIIVSYDYDERRSEDITPAKFILYNRNAFTWENLDKIASFITPQDVNIKNFSRKAIQFALTQNIEDSFISDNFSKALIIFNALGEYGMTYITDPNRPFSATKSNNAIDYIQYPAESLKAKSGDCDDCVVLYASCLENVGISVLTVDVPDHIFLLFDTGLTPEKANKLLPDNMYVNLWGKIWIPIETTMFKKGFYSAWKYGCEEFEEYLNEEDMSGKEIIRISFIEKAWKKYPSADISIKEYNISLSKNKLRSNIRKEFLKILKNNDLKYNELLNEYNKNPDDIVINNKLGVYYAQKGLFSLAFEYFKKALSINKNYPSALNNIGNLYLLNEEYEKAIKYYKKSLSISPDNESIKENLNKALTIINK